MNNTNEFKPKQSYIEISQSTGSIYVAEGEVLLTIQSSQPNINAPVMASLSKGEHKPIKVGSGSKLYAMSANLTEAVISYTEA